VTPSRPPLRLLIASTETSTEDEPLAFERAAAVLSAAEAQGGQVELVWLRPATRAALATRLQGSEPAFDIVCLLAPQSEGRIVWPDDAAALAELLAGADVGLTVWVTRGEPALPDGLATLWLDGGMAPPELHAALLALLSELLAGEPLAAACESAQRALAPAVERARLALGAAGVRPLWRPQPESTGVARVVPLPQDDLRPAWQRLPLQPTPGGLALDADAPLIGRVAQRAALEQALTTPEPRIVCLHGPVGRGKTALAAATARWLVRTGAFDRVVYTGLYSGLLPDTLVHDLTWQLLGAEATPGAPEAGVRLREALASGRTLLIWDNVEAPFAPDNPDYDDEARQRLLALARELAHTPGCRLLLVADSATAPPELAPLELQTQTLPELSLAEGAALLQALAGLPPDEATSWRRLLGGSPLVLRCAAARLRAGAAEALRADIERTLPNAAQQSARWAEQGGELAIELLLGDLSPDERLAFNGLGLYPQGLLEPTTLRTIDLAPEPWGRLRAILASAGLLAVQPVQGLTLSRVALQPALAGHLARRITLRQRQALAQHHANSTLGLLGWLPRGEERAPGIARRLLRLELANIVQSVALAAEADLLTLAAELVQTAVPLLAAAGLGETATALRRRVDRAAATAVPAEGPLSRAAVRFVLGQAERILQSGRIDQAAPLLQGLVKRITAEKGQTYAPPEATLDQGLALKLLASLLKASLRPDLVAGTLRQAIALLNQARSLPEARSAEAQAWRELGEALLLTRQPDAAHEAAERGLELAQQLDDPELIGLLQAQQGGALAASGEAEAALASFQRAADGLQKASAWPALCSLWEQVALLHESQRHDLAAAIDALSRGLAVASAAELPALRGSLLMRRARLQALLEQPGLTAVDLQAAVDAYRQAGEPQALMGALRALAEHHLGQSELDDAALQATRALEVSQAGGQNAVAWEIYHLLQRVAHARGDAEQEAAWRQRTQRAFALSPAAATVLQQWFGLIRAIAESCRGASLSAEAAEAVEKIEADAQGRMLADAIWAVLGGARGPQVYRDLDHASALIVRTILHGIDHPEMFERAPADGEAPHGSASGG
jgi:tetratricopeptide (TPR) repeat protein